EIASGSSRFKVPNADFSSDTCVFASDGRSLVAITSSGNQKWLAYYDLSTGIEQADRRIPLPIREARGMRAASNEIRLVSCSRDPQYLLVQGEPRLRQPTRLEKWLAKIPMLETLGEQKEYDTFILLDARTGCEIMRGGSTVFLTSPDGRFLMSLRNKQELEIGDMPPRKPLRWLLSVGAGWTLLVVIVCLAARRARRRAARRSRSASLHQAPSIH